MNEKLYEDWLAKRGISLEQGFAESLHEYALEYKKNGMSVLPKSMHSLDVGRRTFRVGGNIPMQSIRPAGSRSVLSCKMPRNFLG